MKRTRIRSRQRALGFLLTLLAAACPGFAKAQTPPKVSAPPKVQAAAPRTLILPEKVVADAPATLAVLDAAGRLLPNVVVEFSSGQKVTTDVTGRAFFVAPLAEGVLTARISGPASPAGRPASRTGGRDVTASSMVVSAPVPASTENPAPAAPAISYPHFVSIHDRFTINGSGFRGEADANHVFLADLPCLVLASSPVSLVVLPGLRSPIGAVGLRMNAAGPDAGVFTAPNPVTVVLLEVTGPAETIRVGTLATLTVQVRGTAEPVVVEVRNGSPGIIQLIRGNVQRLTTSGGAHNIAQVEMKCLTSGDYTVTARLAPPDSGAGTHKKD